MLGARTNLVGNRRLFPAVPLCVFQCWAAFLCDKKANLHPLWSSGAPKVIYRIDAMVFNEDMVIGLHSTASLVLGKPPTFEGFGVWGIEYLGMV